MQQMDAPIPREKKRTLTVLSAGASDANDLYYPMTHFPRGYAVILNHENYEDDWVAERKGTNKDVERLRVTLTDLGFEVEVKEDLTWCDIARYLNEVSQRQHLYKHDCFVLFVLTHGGEGNILCARDMPYAAHELVQPFLGVRCKALINKPKLFFIQACKGNKIPNIPRWMKDAKVFKQAQTANLNVPTGPDILISYATIEGYSAFRDPLWGTPYILCLCDELKRSGKLKNLIEILTLVHHRLSTSIFRLSDENHQILVHASFMCSLKRFILFNDRQSSSKTAPLPT